MRLPHFRHQWIVGSNPGGQACLRCLSCEKTKPIGSDRRASDAAHSAHSKAWGHVPGHSPGGGMGGGGDGGGAG